MSSVVGATTSAAHRITMSPIWVSPCYSFTWLAINRYTWDRFGLMTMIQTAVENMHQLDQILPAVRDLGRRHAGYGVKAADYDTVAGALLGTLEQAQLIAGPVAFDAGGTGLEFS